MAWSEALAPNETVTGDPKPSDLGFRVADRVQGICGFRDFVALRDSGRRLCL